jgi:hypothetical protein
VTPLADIRTGEPASEYFFARNTYRFGGSGTGTHFHGHRASWLRLQGGFKIWFFYPPGSPAATKFSLIQDPERTYGGEPVSVPWFLTRDPEATGGPGYRVLNHSYAQSVREGQPPQVCIQRPGTFMFVGDDWHHAIVNAGLTTSTAVFAQVTYLGPPEALPQPVRERFDAEYHRGGHTARSAPKLNSNTSLERNLE